jgi:anti-anti-sigma regulatory factor
VFWQLPRPGLDGAAAQTVALVALVDLDIATERRARTELAVACAGAGTHQRVLVQIGAGCFVDVRGLAVLIDAARAATRRGRRLLIVDPPASLRLCLAVVGPEDSLAILNHSGLREIIPGIHDLS